MHTHVDARAAVQRAEAQLDASGAQGFIDNFVQNQGYISIVMDEATFIDTWGADIIFKHESAQSSRDCMLALTPRLPVEDRFLRDMEASCREAPTHSSLRPPPWPLRWATRRQLIRRPARPRCPMPPSPTGRLSRWPKIPRPTHRRRVPQRTPSRAVDT